MIANKNKQKREKIQANKALRQAFKEFVDLLATPRGGNGEAGWICCHTTFTELPSVHKHVSTRHQTQIQQQATLKTGENRLPIMKENVDMRKDTVDNANNMHQRLSGFWDGLLSLPPADKVPQCCLPEVVGPCTNGKILLFYRYCDITDPDALCSWQTELCQRLHLNGKIQIGLEGINATVGGSTISTQLYIKIMLSNSLFSDMRQEDFKSSSGCAKNFPNGMQVRVCKEIVPMGILPENLSYKQSGDHLSVTKFHQALLEYTNDKNYRKNTILIDCRNFYESKIGKFKGALTPNIRKFSYWPEYVDKNLDMFEGKRVLMYCTGGIRCERGSAYLKNKGVCTEVFQLEGGIHKYLEKYPGGLFQGKLFVFDDRFALPTDTGIIAGCSYCETPWDGYKTCSSQHCHQLVLSCDQCRAKGHTSCCSACQAIAAAGFLEENKIKEECHCTRGRERIPREKNDIF